MTEENITIVNETPVVKKKFTIVKNIDLNTPNRNESLPATPNLNEYSKKKNDFEWNFDSDSESSDFNVNITKTNLQYKQSSKLSINESENDDVFNESLPLNPLNLDSNYREQEGQDTITSLSNNIYLKQLHRIRKKAASVKSKSSSQSITEDNSLTESNENLSKPLQDSSNTSSKTNIRSFFKNRDSIVSRKSIELDKQDSINSIINKSFLDLTQLNSSHDLVNLLINPKTKDSQTKLDDSEMNNPSNLPVTTTSPQTKSEQVFQVLKEVIDHTNDTEATKKIIEQVMLAVRMQQEKEKRKKDFQKKICFGLEIFVFISIFLLSVLLVEKVILKLQLIYTTKFNFTTKFDSYNLTHFTQFRNDSLLINV